MHPNEGSQSSQIDIHYLLLRIIYLALIPFVTFIESPVEYLFMTCHNIYGVFLKYIIYS